MKVFPLPLPAHPESSGTRRVPACWLALILWVLAAEPSAGAWGPLGVPVCDGCAGQVAGLVPDGQGGAYVFWNDGRNFQTTRDDLYLQRLAPSGDVAPGWPVGGLLVCGVSETQAGLGLIPDGDRGAVALWYDARAIAQDSGVDLYAQRVRPDGSLAGGWVLNGSPVTRAPSTQTFGALAPDGAGGAFFVWEDYQQYLTQGIDVYAQHLTGEGSVAQGWLADGNPVGVVAGHQEFPVVANDGAGGAYMGWLDFRDSPTEFGFGQTFASRVLSDGALAPGWTANGTRLFEGDTWARELLPAPLGDVYVMRSVFNVAHNAESVYVAHRLTPSGAPALGWPAEGVVICDAPGTRAGPRLADDGYGGLLMTWTDFGRAPGQPGGGCEVYVTRLMADGTRPPGWPANGLRVSDSTPSPYCESESRIAPDGTGGLYVTWARDTVPTNVAVIQHITATGQIAPGWQLGGLRIKGSSLSVTDPWVASDGTGGAIVVFRTIGAVLNAQRYVTDGVVATTLSLVRAQGHADRVELAWEGSGPVGFEATLERNETEGEWLERARLHADGTGRLEYVDREVLPARRYGYRLKWNEGGADRLTAPTWLETTSELRFALIGLTPNPSDGPIQVAFTLPARASGELDFLDVSGRRVAVRDISSLGPGHHVLRLDDRAPLAPGMYLARLRWNARVATARAVILK